MQGVQPPGINSTGPKGITATSSVTSNNVGRFVEDLVQGKHLGMDRISCVSFDPPKE